MRRYFVGTSLFFMLLLSTAQAPAQTIIDKDQTSQRIKELKARLQNYQKSIREPVETVELKLEKISRSLESRDDVAVTVLFHDSGDETLLPKLTPKKTVFSDDSDSVNLRIEEENDWQTARLKEIEDRKKLFDSLRNKVQQATRRTRKNAANINELVAKLQ